MYACHGKNDSVVSAGGGRAAVDVLRSKGANVKRTEFDGGHLGIFTNMKIEITGSIEEKLSGLR